MTITATRRTLLAAAGAAIAAPALSRSGRADPADALSQLERSVGGRLGVAILDTGSGRRLAHRADERFALCSTFKVLASAQVLSRVDRGEDRLDARVVFAANDLVEYSPATQKRVGPEGMSVAEVCEAAITLSDNTAGNLLLARIGGPAGLTAWCRSLGDGVTRLDRIETALNEAASGDPRDTTTPAAMLGMLGRLVLGDALSPGSRNQLVAWLVANKTGDRRLRAGLPKEWRVGDKTGTGSNGSANDVGVIWPPGRAPIVVASYFAEAQVSPERRNEVHAEVGRIAAAI